MSLQKKHVLFVSIGGKCRSPMAAGILQKMITGKDLEGEWFVDFAALSPIHIGEFVDPRVTTILKKKKILPLHPIRLATEADLRDSDFVLCMDELDKKLVKHIGAHWVAKVKVIGDYHPGKKCEIRDLYYDEDDHEDVDNYKKFGEMYKKLEKLIAAFLRRQLKPQESDSEMDDAAMPVLERYDPV